MNCLTVEEKLSKLGIKYLRDIPLSSYTSFGIGGKVNLAVFPANVSEAVATLDLLRKENIRFTVLGNGTNVLVDDRGFEGAALILSGLRSCSLEGEIIHADAGMPLTGLSLFAQKNSLSGLEFAYGIPGTVGGGIYMNAGAYGGEMSQVTVVSRYYDTDTGEMGAFFGDEHDFSYRHSVYNDSSKVILSADISLKRGDGDEIKEIMDGYMRSRREKQPLEYPSAGSVFKRGNGFITAKLIDEAGLRGRRVGGAEVSEKHAGFIVNRGGATSADVLNLIEIIKEEVKARFGHDIYCEIKYIV